MSYKLTERKKKLTYKVNRILEIGYVNRYVQMEFSRNSRHRLLRYFHQPSSSLLFVFRAIARNYAWLVLLAPKNTINMIVTTKKKKITKPLLQTGNYTFANNSCC